MLEQLRGGKNRREILGCADIARVHHAKSGRQLARFGIGGLRRHAPIEILGAVRQIANAAARHAMRFDRRDERLGLHEDAVATTVDPLDQAVDETQHRAILDRAGRRQALGPEILHPEEERNALQRTQRSRRNADRHWGRLIDENRVEASAREPGGEQRREKGMRKKVDRQTQAAAVTSRDQRSATHLGRLVPLAHWTQETVAGEVVSAWVIRHAGVDRDGVPARGETFDDIVDAEILRPEILAENQ